MIWNLKGNLLESDVDIICHQVNCQGVMGAGLAKQIKEKYPRVYADYKWLCESVPPEELLGDVQVVRCGGKKYVANIFGQLSYGRDRVHTDYQALESALQLLFKFIREDDSLKDLSVGFPKGMGSGLAGGDWNRVMEIISKTAGDLTVYIYEYK